MNKRARKRLKEAIAKDKQERKKSLPQQRQGSSKDPQELRGFLPKPEKKRGQAFVVSACSLITSVVITGLGDFLFGRRLLETGAIFIPLVIASLILTIVQTFLIYRYFSPPKKPPQSKFLLQPQSEILGDVCIFVNMILFQVFWNMLTFAGLGHPSGPLEFAGRLFFLSFIALLIYFPPRMFYLAEDINRPRTWLTKLLANSPVIVRVLIGTGPNTTTGW